MRAINSARDAGVPVATVEIIANDGTIIKIHGPDARHDQPLDTWLQRKADSRAVVAPGEHAAAVRRAKPRAKVK
jgi:hypothetical protein